MTVRYRSEKFIKDLIIQGDDGRMYYIRAAEMEQFEKEEGAFKPNVRLLLNQNIALGALPEPEGAEPPPLGAENDLGFCYLINLASLRVPGDSLSRRAEVQDAAEPAEAPARAARGKAKHE